MPRFRGPFESIAGGVRDDPLPPSLSAGIQAVDDGFVRAGRVPRELSRAFEPSGASIVCWDVRAGSRAVHRVGVSIRGRRQCGATGSSLLATGLCVSPPRRFTTSPGVPIRLPSRDGSRRLRRRACATGTGACTCCSGERVEYQHEENTQDIQRAGPSVEGQVSQAAGEGEAVRRSPGSRRAERCPGNGLRPRPARDGKKLRILTAVGTYSRYSRRPIHGSRIRGEHVVQTLERVCRVSGDPKRVRVDSGSEFASCDLDLWACANAVVLDVSRLGKPIRQRLHSLPGRASHSDVPKREAFNSKLRAACPTVHWFMSLADSREQLEAWHEDHNEVRPYSAIGSMPRRTSTLPTDHPARRRDQKPKTLGPGAPQKGRGAPRNEPHLNSREKQTSGHRTRPSTSCTTVRMRHGPCSFLQLYDPAREGRVVCPD